MCSSDSLQDRIYRIYVYNAHNNNQNWTLRVKYINIYRRVYVTINYTYNKWVGGWEYQTTLLHTLYLVTNFLLPVKWPTEISPEHEYNECDSDKLYKSVKENGRPKVKRGNH